MSLLIMDKSKTAKVPTLPASVGVKKPYINPPMTSRKTPTTHSTYGRLANRCFQVDLSPFGPSAGLILHQT